MIKLINGDCLLELPKLKDKIFDLVIADPPFNIGFKYDKYKDNREEAEYLKWCYQWVGLAYAKLKDNGSFWLFIGPKYVSELDILSKEAGFIKRNHVIWKYNFGNCQKTKYTPCSTHILYYIKDEKNFTFNSDAIKIPSVRQLMKDKRAAKGGKIPGDVWEYARIAGTFKRRIKGFPCQVPVEIMERIILTSTNRGDTLLDVMAGSGSSLVAAKKLGRDAVGIELSAAYCKIIEERLV